MVANNTNNTSAAILARVPGEPPIHVCLAHGRLNWPEKYGGVVRLMLGLAQGLTAAGARVTVLAWAGETSPALIATGATVVTVPEPSPRLPLPLRNVLSAWHFHRKLTALARREKVDIAEFSSYMGEAFFATRFARIPIVIRAVTLVTQTENYYPARTIRTKLGRRWRAWFEAQPIKNANRVIVPTLEHARALRQELELDALPTVAPLGVELHGERDAPLDRTAAIRFLFVGRAEPRKGLDLLLDAFSRVSASDRDPVELVLAGTGETPYLEELLAKMAAPARQHVTVAGWIEDESLPNLYRSADVLVAPSRYESFGLIFSEAMQLGLPTIGLRAGGAPEVVSHGETGLLVSPDDPDQLAEAMLSLAQDASLRERFGEAGRERWRQRFSVNAMTQTTLAQYRSVLSNRAL